MNDFFFHLVVIFVSDFNFELLKSNQNPFQKRVDFLCNSTNPKPTDDKAFVMFNWTYAQNQDLDDMAEKEFEQFYSDAVKWFQYPGNKNMKECFQKSQNANLGGTSHCCLS